MTRFSRIFSTILSLRAITGREENFDDENGFEYDELHDEVGDEAIATHFLSLSLSLLEFFLVYSLVSLFVLQNLIEKQWDMKNNNKNSCFCFFFTFAFFIVSLSLSLSLPPLVSLFDGQ